MTLTQPGPNIKKIIKWAAPLLIAAVFALALAWRLGGDEHSDAQSDSLIQVGDKAMSQARILKNLEASAEAAVAAGPVTGTLAGRPDFVSEFEWQVLQNAAAQLPNESGRELTTLVNKLLFAKKKEAWLASAVDTALRKDLARQMLEMIPAQVQSGAIHPVAAGNLERELQADLAVGGH
ncbi:MAG TPA: hypothetical protein P5295_11045 [Spirochaetota bacterium]|nr:hypothetical protein [Spirochaetota bacterium]